MYRKILQFYRKNPDATHYTLCAATLGCGVSLAGLILGIFSPYAGEIVQNFFIRLSFWINLVMGVGALLCFAAFLIWNFKKGIVITTPDVAGMLQASNWVEPTIGRDILVCLRPGESDEAFYNRQLAAKTNAEPAFWAVVIPFRKPYGMLYRGGSEYLEFKRDEPPFNSDLAEQNRIPAGVYFTEETRSNYEKYLDWFAYHFAEWSGKAKVIKEENKAAKVELFDTLLKPSVNILLCLLLSLPAFGQNAAAVNAILGKNAAAIPAEGAQVEFMFERGKSVFRTGNGKSTFTKLLEIPGFAYSKAAPVAVIVNNQIVGRAPAAGEVAATTNNKAAAMRPISEIPPSEVTPGGGWQMPDSSTNAANAEWVKYKAWELNETAGRTVRPWWGVLIFCVWMIIGLIFLAFAISFLWAFVAAKEGMYETHKKARRICAWILLSLASVGMVQSYLYMMDANIPVGGIIVLLMLELVAICWLATVLIPNFRPSTGNEPRGRAAYTPVERQLDR